MRRAILPLALALAASWSPAHGHVAPSTSTNNRYLKVTPMADRVRLTYTVYMGEIPGARARSRMDRDRDRVLSPAETDAYGAEMAAAVKGAIDVTVDGAPRPVTWELVHVGLGTPVIGGGSFSIDLIAWFCLESGGRSHTLTLTDRFRISAPGEVELRVDESPGVTVTRSRVGGSGAKKQLAFAWSNTQLPLAQSPFELAFDVAPDAVVPADEICAASPEPTGRKGSGGTAQLIATVGGAVLLVAIAILVVRKGAI